MAYAILRIAKLKSSGNIGACSQHMERTRETPNADQDLQKFNKRVIGSGDLNRDIQNRLEEEGIKPRANAVLALEHLITASPEHFDYKKRKTPEGEIELRGNVKAWNEFEEEALKWLEQTYGKKNIVNFTVHKDESSPHIHAIVTPIKEKVNERSGKRSMKLCAKDWTGGRKAMADLQTSFADQVKHLGLERGKEFSRAKHTTVKEFYAEIQPQELSRSQIPQIKAPTALERLNPQKYIENQQKQINDFFDSIVLKYSQELQQKQFKSVSEKLQLKKSAGLKEEKEKLLNELKIASEKIGNHEKELDQKFKTTYNRAAKRISEIMRDQGINYKVELNWETKSIDVKDYDWEKEKAKEQQRFRERPSPGQNLPGMG